MISIFKNLNIFNSEYFYSDSENEVFCEIANFLQHFQQCLYLFCESNLLNRIKTILYDIVNKWFDDQSKFISLREFDIILTNAFSFSVFNIMFSSNFRMFAFEFTSESTKRSTTCKHCDEIFNFKKSFREHKREQHAKKFVVNSRFLIDAVKLTCESMKISTINSSFSVSFAIQSKQMFELFTFFELLLFAFFDTFNSTRFH